MEFSKFDELIYLVEESDKPIDEVIHRIKQLFPLFNPKSDAYNDKFLSDFSIDKYAYNRSLGLPIVEVANSIQITATLLYRIFQGERVSLDKLVELAKAENFAIAERKAAHLALLEKSDGKTSTITFLEKAFSKQYGDRKHIDINTGFEQAEDKNKWTIEVTRVGNTNKVSDDEEKFIDAKGEDDAEESVSEGEEETEA